MISIERTIETRHLVGLIVNPVAGLGGPSGLKGSDRPDIRELTKGRTPRALERAAAMLASLIPMRESVRLLAAPGEMGADAAASSGWNAETVGETAGKTTANDTRVIAAAMAERAVEVLLFVGGDGTAVDILVAVGDRVPVIGVPAGVKMHSGVFALAPALAGRLTEVFLRNRSRQTMPAEVMDLDEAAARKGIAVPRLHGTLRVPLAERLIQSPKVRSRPSDAAAAAELGAAFQESMINEAIYVIGPGTTTSAILQSLGLHHTLLGVDVLRGGRLLGTDVDDETLAALIGSSASVHVVVTPIGGQGFVFGRGNQQISPGVISRAGSEGLMVVATEAKLASLGGRPLLVDTGDPGVDEMLTGPGYVKVLVGRGRWSVYPIQRAEQGV